MVADVISYNGEEELFDIRYNILKGCVDEFIVVESTQTFSGNDKPLYFERIKANYPGVTYVVNEGNYTPEEIKQAEESPNTKGAAHWKLEFMQKERIKLAIDHLRDEDIVFIGDCDEIWKPSLILILKTIFVISHIAKLKLDVYTYYLNNRSNEEFWGTVVSKYKYIKKECLNHVRSNSQKIGALGGFHGWHFTSMYHQLRQKLIDSYTEESYNTKAVQDALSENIKQRKDFLGRNFIYKKDESNWPQFLKDNKNNYKHLLL